MGRTNPTFRDQLQRFEEEWQPYRRALRREQQADFDRLFERAADHASAAGYQNPSNPELAVLFSILLSQERELQQLKDEIDDTES